MNEKKCSKCQLVKPLSEFHKNRATRDGHTNYCIDCARSIKRESYQYNKEAAYRRARIKKDINQKVIYEAKNVPCMDCGISYPPYVMDFDHRPGEVKLKKLSAMYGASLDLVSEEISKCDVVCANCHRERTFQRMQLED